MGGVSSRSKGGHIKQSHAPPPVQLQKLVPADIHRSDGFDENAPCKDVALLRKNLRVLFIHGGGGRTGVQSDLTQKPVPSYLRERYQNFHATNVADTSDFEGMIATHARAIRFLSLFLHDPSRMIIIMIPVWSRSFQPDVVIGKSQGSPCLKHLIDRGVWRGPSLLIVPAFVHMMDDLHFAKDYPSLLVFGDQDVAVPLSTRNSVNEVNAGLKEDSELKIYTFADGHSMNLITYETFEHNLDVLIKELWEMKFANKAYAHEKRFPPLTELQLNKFGLTST